jgi:hypothetical protein
MGFLDYARSISLQKDDMKARIRIDPELQLPNLTQDKAGFNVTLPLPSVPETEEEEQEKTVSFLGYQFPADGNGKARVGRLFRACVFHLTTHTMVPVSEEKLASLNSERSLVEAFSESLVNDVYVHAYLAAWYPDKLADMAYANALAYTRMRRVETIFNPATRIMVALLSRLNMGTVKGVLQPEEKKAVDHLTKKVSALKKEIMAALAREDTEIGEVMDATANEITQTLENFGPILEAPSLQYTEQAGPCTIYSQKPMPSDFEMEKIFRESLATLGGTIPSEDSVESCWRKESNIEAAQAFDTWFHQKAREKKVLTKLEKYTELSRFKTASFPTEDYTRYLRARALVKGTSRRLLDSLRVAQDALDEDPRKLFGQLDLTAVVQMMAAGRPRQDVFMRDEYLSRSYAWSLLLDVSASMRVKGENARAMAICIAEATKELLMDPGSWTFFAFSDKFYVLKDASEAYSRRVRARIGGLRFGGLTYMPDAIQVAGEILAQRFDEQRFLVVLSDGWPYGYPNMHIALAETIRALEKKGIIVIGVGLETERMKNYFKASTAVYNQRDLIKAFAKLYVQTSAGALES